MTPGQIFLWVLAVVALGFCLRRGPATVHKAGVETGRNLVKILPMFAVALPMAAFLAELIPADAAVAISIVIGIASLAMVALIGGATVFVGTSGRRHEQAAVPPIELAQVVAWTVPLIAATIVALTGNIFAGLWYTWVLLVVAVAVAWWGLPSGPPRDFADDTA